MVQDGIVLCIHLPCSIAVVLYICKVATELASFYDLAGLLCARQGMILGIES